MTMTLNTEHTSYDTSTVRGRARAYSEELVRKGFLPQRPQDDVIVFELYAEHLENEKLTLESKIRFYERTIRELIVSGGTK